MNKKSILFLFIAAQGPLSPVYATGETEESPLLIDTHNQDMDIANDSPISASTMASPSLIEEDTQNITSDVNNYGEKEQYADSIIAEETVHDVENHSNPLSSDSEHNALEAVVPIAPNQEDVSSVRTQYEDHLEDNIKTTDWFNKNLLDSAIQQQDDLEQHQNKIKDIDKEIGDLEQKKEKSKGNERHTINRNIEKLQNNKKDIENKIEKAGNAHLGLYAWGPSEIPHGLKETLSKNVKLIEFLPDSDQKIFYEAFRPAEKTGDIKGASSVATYDPRTEKVARWEENYDEDRNVKRIHLKDVNKENKLKTYIHYPPTGKDFESSDPEIKSQLDLWYSPEWFLRTMEKLKNIIPPAEAIFKEGENQLLVRNKSAVMERQKWPLLEGGENLKQQKKKKSKSVTKLFDQGIQTLWKNNAETNLKAIDDFGHLAQKQEDKIPENVLQDIKNNLNITNKGKIKISENFDKNHKKINTKKKSKENKKDKENQNSTGIAGQKKSIIENLKADKILWDSPNKLNQFMQTQMDENAIAAAKDRLEALNWIKSRKLDDPEAFNQAVRKIDNQKVRGYVRQLQNEYNQKNQVEEYKE